VHPASPSSLPVRIFLSREALAKFKKAVTPAKAGVQRRL